MVGVVITTTGEPVRTFWKAPASWSAWQCVMMIPTIIRGRIPSLSRVADRAVRYDFRRHVACGSNMACHFWLIDVHSAGITTSISWCTIVKARCCQAKVSNLCMVPGATQEYVAGLEITMNDVLLVDVLKSIQDFLHKCTNCLFAFCYSIFSSYEYQSEDTYP